MHYKQFSWHFFVSLRDLRAFVVSLMFEHAQQWGANAIVGMRYDATEVMAGLTEVLCYGTAVVASRKRS